MKHALLILLLVSTQAASAQEWAKEKLEKSPRHREWVNVGSYRRALSSYDVKMASGILMGAVVPEPTAYEIVDVIGQAEGAAYHDRASCMKATIIIPAPGHAAPGDGCALK